MPSMVQCMTLGYKTKIAKRGGQRAPVLTEPWLHASGTPDPQQGRKHRCSFLKESTQEDSEKLGNLPNSTQHS